MIAYIKGKIINKTNRSVVVLAGNVGYEVFLPLKQLETTGINDEKEFYVHSHIKEDLFDLYGFANQEELDFFKKVISVSGVGPKSALNILGLASVDDLKKAIASEDPSLLQQVSGIGKKTAERLVVELKEKFIVDLSERVVVSDKDKQVVDGLISLGYKESEAKEAVNSLSKEETDLATRIKQALQFLNK